MRRDSCVGPGNAVLTQAIYVRVATSSEPFTTVWRVGSATGVAAGVAAYRGVDDDRPVQSSGGAVSRNSAFTSDSLRRPGAGTLVAGFFGRNEAGGITTPRGTTHRYLASTPLASVLAVDDVRTAAGTTGLARRTPVHPVLVQHRAGRRAQVGLRLGLRHAADAADAADASDAPGPPEHPPTPPPPADAAGAAWSARHHGTVCAGQRALDERDADLRRRRLERIDRQRPRHRLRRLP